MPVPYGRPRPRPAPAVSRTRADGRLTSQTRSHRRAPRLQAAHVSADSVGSTLAVAAASVSDEAGARCARAQTPHGATGPSQTGQRKRPATRSASTTTCSALITITLTPRSSPGSGSQRPLPRAPRGDSCCKQYQTPAAPANAATSMVINSITAGGTAAVQHPQIADDYRDPAGHHHHPGVDRDQQPITSPRSTTFDARIVTTQRVAQHQGEDVVLFG